MKIGIKTLKVDTNGIAVYTTAGLIHNVPENIVRCAIGENDMDYLLRSRVDESHCFGILESELQDFIKYGELR